MRAWKIAAYALGVLAAAQSAPAADPGTLEYAVKANFLYKFGDYVTWPAGTLGGDSAPVNLCVVGPDPFGRVLDEAVMGERIAAHPVQVRRIPRADENCHVVFTRSDPDAVNAVKGRPVLTISEGNAGAVITFVIRDNRVRFEIDQQAAAVNGLDVSSRLLALAVRVKPKVSP